MSFAAGINEFFEMGLSVRVHPMSLPQGAVLPAVVYRVISDDPSITHSDAQDAPTYTGVHYTASRVQFDCIADTYDEAEAVRNELYSLAVGYRGMWGDIEVDRVTPDLRLDDWEPEVPIYRVIQDLIVGHRSVQS